jgi:cytochrome c-type biogenesis protein CcmF
MDNMYDLVGQMTLWLAMLLAAMALISGLAATLRRDSLAWTAARDSLLAASALVLAATATLLAAFIRHDFSLNYVAINSELQLPLIYRISALWRGADGSLLLWAALLAIGAIIYILRYRRTPSRHHALAAAGIAGQMLLLTVLLVTVANPFAPLEWPPVDGYGMKLLLEVWAMVVHPPVTFAAYAAFGVAAAISLAALATGRLRDHLPALRLTLLVGWLTMTAGIVLGAYWAYTDLGWGGYWSWDPVENTSLIPWLMATAALHTMRLAPAGRLVATTHALSIFSLLTCFVATFTARGGIPTQSRHTYAPSPLVNAYLLFIVLLLLVTIVLLVLNKWRQRRRAGSTAATRMTPAVAIMIVTTGMLALFAIAVTVGTLGPGVPLWLQQSFGIGPGGNVQPVETERFDRLGAVFGMTLLAALGVCPWMMRAAGDTRTRILITNAVIVGLLGVIGIAADVAALWIAASVALGLWIIVGQVLRLARGGLRFSRMPATVAHLALLMLFVAIILAHNLSHQDRFTMRPGEQAEFAGLTFRYDSLQRTPIEERRQFLTTAHLTMLRDDRPVARLSPSHLRRLNLLPGQSQPDQRGDIGMATGPIADIIVSLDTFDETEMAGFTIRRRPAVLWIWIASALLSASAIIALLPRAGPAPSRKTEETV